MGFKIVIDSSDLMVLFLLVGIGFLAILACVIALAVIKKKERQGKPVKNASPGTVFLIFGSLIAVGVYIANPSDFGATVLSVAIIALVVLLIARNRKKKKATSANLFYDKSADALVLRNRTATNKSVLSFEDVLDNIQRYKPEELVYTGATVGGIHTGGFHKEGGYYYIDKSATGKYMILFDNTESRTFITKIKLLDSKMVRQAQKNTFISQFLKGDTLELKHGSTSKYDDKVNSAIDLGRSDIATYFIKQSVFDTLLTKAECKKVIAWLCGEE